MSSRKLGSALQAMSGTLNIALDHFSKQEMMAAEEQMRIRLENLRQKNNLEFLGEQQENALDVISARGGEQRVTDIGRSKLRTGENQQTFQNQLSLTEENQLNELERIEARGEASTKTALARYGGRNTYLAEKDMTDRERALWDTMSKEMADIGKRMTKDGIDPEKAFGEYRSMLARIQQSPDVRNNPLFRAQTNMLMADHIEKLPDFIPAAGGNTFSPMAAADKLRYDAADLLDPLRTEARAGTEEPVQAAAPTTEFTDIPGQTDQSLIPDMIGSGSSASPFTFQNQIDLIRNPPQKPTPISSWESQLPIHQTGQARQRPSVLPNKYDDLIANR